MITEFIDFCKELFPSISPYTAERAKTALLQFEKDGKIINYITNKLNKNELFQGDIFSDIPFYYMQSDGSYGIVKHKAQLLTNTCDAVRNDNLNFAAVLPLKQFSDKFQNSIIKNKTYQFLYLPDNKTKDFVIDFGLIHTISREAFIKAINHNKIKKIVSLSDIGYYMFICKLTVYFMRPEDIEVNNLRGEDYNYE